jgi:hypothetical protein
MLDMMKLLEPLSQIGRNTIYPRSESSRGVRIRPEDLGFSS